MNESAVLRMDWRHLFNPNRVGVDYVKEIDLRSTRSAFIKDYDRILFSASFRKLQNKTQVFPLTDEIFVHSRLTHSLETASVGTTLGREVGRVIARTRQGDEIFQHFYENELQHVIAAACLAHDIGNPPFGHSGEKAISEYFSHVFPEAYPNLIGDLPKEAMAELCHFEGNANGFRILTHAFNNEGGGEFKLTYPTLAAIAKYPCRAIDGNDKATGLISTKKYNSFLTEWHHWEKIAGELHLPAAREGSGIYCRHPFVYLVEAADDLCYLVIDLEDAHRLGLAPFRETFQLLRDLLGAADPLSVDKADNSLGLIASDEQKVAYLRALVINTMILQLVEVFLMHEEELLNGNLNRSLTGLLEPALAAQWDALETYSLEKIYCHPRVMEREMAGYRILQGLMEEFTHALVNSNSLRSNQLLTLIPHSCRNLEYPGELYHDLRSVLDFLSDMTDQEAIRLYRRLKGIEI